MRKCFYCLIILFMQSFLCSGQSFSKSPLYSDDHSFNVNHVHHFYDSTKYVIYLPSLRFGLNQKGPKITDYISRNENGVLLVNPVAALPFAKDQNIIQSGGRINGLGFAMKITSAITIAASYGMQYVSHLDYPLQALDLYTAGNAIIFGQQLDLSFKTTAQAFHSYSIASNYTKDRFSIGAKVSLLSGISDISVDRSKLLLKVAPLFYNLTTDTHFRINTSDLLTYESFENIIIDYTGDFGKSFLSTNRGFSISLIANYDVNDRTRLSFSLEDIGRITWKSNPINYGTSGIQTFNGVNVLDLINPNISVSYQDSLEQLLHIEESQESYDTNLPISFNVGVTHQLNQDVSVSGSVYYNTFASFSNYAVGLGGHYKLSQKISLTASVHHSPLQAISLGLGGSIRFGMFNIFAFTNNITSILNNTDAAYTYGSIGINLNF